MTTTETYGCPVHGEDDAYQGCALCELESLRSRLADIEAQNRVMWDVANDREARLAEVDANAPWLTQAHILCSDHGIPPGNISDRLSLLRIRLAELPEKLAEVERDAERYRRLRVDPSLVVGPSYVLRRTDELDAAIDAAMDGVRHASNCRLFAYWNGRDEPEKCSCGADQPGAIIESEIKRDNRLRADQLAAAGYTKRDTRLQCDECGRMFTPQLLPAHKCAADQPTERVK